VCSLLFLSFGVYFMSVYISGIPKAKLLAALYNVAGRSRVMDEGEAQSRLDIRGGKVDYANGVALHVDISGDELDAEAYDAKFGDGAAQAVVEELRREIEAENLTPTG